MRQRASLSLLVLILGLVAACNGSQRQKTLRATLVGMNAARDGLVVFDKSHQLAIVEKATTREDGEQQLAAYRAKRAPVVDGFELAYRLLALAATQNDDPSLKAALEASKSMLEAIRSLTGGL